MASKKRLMVVLALTVAAIAGIMFWLTAKGVDLDAEAIDDPCEGNGEYYDMSMTLTSPPSDEVLLLEYRIKDEIIPYEDGKATQELWVREQRYHETVYSAVGDTIKELTDETIGVDSLVSSEETALDASETSSQDARTRLAMYSRAVNLSSGQWEDWQVQVSEETHSIGSNPLETAFTQSDSGEPYKLFCGYPVIFFNSLRLAGEDVIRGLKTSHYIAISDPDVLNGQGSIKLEWWIDDSGKLIQQKWDKRWSDQKRYVSTMSYSGFGAPNIIVAPVTGTLHEAFVTAGASGGAVGFIGGAGSLEPSGFASADGTATEIQELKWRDGAVLLTLAPHAPLVNYALDFIALDGSVLLSLEVPSAAADSASGTLSWPVAAAPWADGDLLMLRIRETGSQPILPLTATPAPTPTTPLPTPTPAPTANELSGYIPPRLGELSQLP